MYVEILNGWICNVTDRLHHANPERLKTREFRVFFAVYNMVDGGGLYQKRICKNLHRLVHSFPSKTTQKNRPCDSKTCICTLNKNAVLTIGSSRQEKKYSIIHYNHLYKL